MKPLSDPILHARSRVFKALAHPARLAMVEELTRGERCVCQLQPLVGLDLSTVSKHLSVLRGAEVVVMEKRGLQVWYRLQMTWVPRMTECVDRSLMMASSPILEAAAAARRTK